MTCPTLFDDVDSTSDEEQAQPTPPRYTLHLGDCREVLRGLPDNSIDAVVCDPPYGLNSGSDGLQDIFLPTLFDVFFPKFNKFVSKSLNLSELDLPLDRISLLNRMNRTFWKEPTVGVPEGSVDFDDDFVDWNEEVKHTNKPPVVVPDGALVDKLESHRIKNGNHFQLKLRRSLNASLSDRSTCGFSHFGFGRITVSVVVPFFSCFAGFLRTHRESDTPGLSDVIRLLNDPLAFAESPSSVVTSRGTELRVMLTLDLGGTFAELRLASCTDKLDAVFEFVCPEQIGAFSGTSSLSAMFQSTRFSFIGGMTDGAFTVDFHKFIVPYIHKQSSGFMGKKWDHDVPGVDVWKEVLRVVKPGGHILAFAGSRTQHRIAVAIEDAGWEIRDTLMWVYGSGFPKSLSVDKSIDKMLGAEREKVLIPTKPGNTRGDRGISYACESFSGFTDISEPVTDSAKQWHGFGTALKPAYEPIILARKPLIGTVAMNVLTHGTGGLNIDGCRVASAGESLNGGSTTGSHGNHEGWRRPWMDDPEHNARAAEEAKARVAKAEATGRWPANFLHDNSPEVTDLLGNAARFFYSPKCSKKDRDEGLDEFEERRTGAMQATADGTMLTGSGNERTTSRRNIHPTVKPTALMRYLCRLITPPGGVILDCFMGSGSTGKAALLEGFQFVGIEQDEDYMLIARARIEAASKQ